MLRQIPLSRMVLDKKWSVLSGDLVKIWIRHQYIKPLIVFIIVGWYFSCVFLTFNYQQHTTNLIQEEYSSHNCTTIKSEWLETGKFSHRTCHQLSDNQYYHQQDYFNLYLETVSCSKEGYNFYTETSLSDKIAKNVYIQFLVKFFGPLVFSYYIYEVLYLAMYDCLIIEPALTQDGTIIRTVDNIVRVGFFFLRTSKSNGADEGELTEERKLELEEHKPGIRLGQTTYRVITGLIGMGWTTIIVIFQNRQIQQCTQMLDRKRDIILSITTCVFLTLSLILASGLYYRRLMQMDSLLDVATKYSYHFKQQSYKFTLSERFPLDAFILPLFPIRVCLILCGVMLLLVTLCLTLVMKGLEMIRVVTFNPEAVWFWKSLMTALYLMTCTETAVEHLAVVNKDDDDLEAVPSAVGNDTL
jgi:hypothetical protein